MSEEENHVKNKQTPSPHETEYCATDAPFLTNKHHRQYSYTTFELHTHHTKHNDRSLNRKKKTLKNVPRKQQQQKTNIGSTARQTKLPCTTYTHGRTSASEDSGGTPPSSPATTAESAARVDADLVPRPPDPPPDMEAVAATTSVVYKL